MDREMRVEVFRSGEIPDYETWAGVFLNKAREFYMNHPEVIKDRDEWKRKRAEEREAAMAAAAEVT